MEGEGLNWRRWLLLAAYRTSKRGGMVTEDDGDKSNLRTGGLGRQEGEWNTE